MNTPARLSTRAEFYEQLASAVEAGVTLKDALRIAGGRSRSHAAEMRIPEIRAALERGRTFGEALADGAPNLPLFDRTMLAAGESSGRIDHTLRLLADHYRTQASLMRTLIGGLAYPAFIALVAVAVFPVSALTALVKDGGSFTAFLIGKIVIVALITAAVIALAWAMENERSIAIRATVEKLVSLIPGLGSARRNMALARLSSMLNALVSSGVLLIQAWEMAADACGSPRLQRAIARWRPQLEAGVTPAELVQQSPEFPEMFTTVYTSGEISGKLDSSLAQLQRYYHDEGSRGLKTFTAILITGIYLAIIFAVAWQIVSFWLGYFQQINDVMQ